MSFGTVFVFSVDGWQALQFFIATVLPLLVGYLSTHVTSDRVKSLSLVAASLVTSFGTDLLDAHAHGQPLDLWKWLITAVGTLALGSAVHHGVYKPTGLTDWMLSHGRTDNSNVTKNG